MSDELDHLTSEVRRALPQVTVSREGNFVDVRLGERWLVIEWRRGSGYGLTLNPTMEDAFSGPKEVLDLSEAALRRSVELLTR